MSFEIPFEKHPAYHSLISKIQDLQIKFKDKLSLPILEIGGIQFALQADLVKKLEEQYQAAVMYTTRDSLDIRKYFDEAQFVDASSLDFDSTLQLIINNNFIRQEKVSEPADFAVTGDVISFWPLGYEHPLRLQFFGDELEEAYAYDEIYGKRYSTVESFIIGDIDSTSDNTVVNNLNINTDRNKALQVLLIFGGDSLDTYQSKLEVNFDFTYPQLFFQRFDLLELEIKKYSDRNINIVLATKNKEALPVNLREYVKPEIELEAGFVSKELGLFYLSDRELFGTVFLSKQSKQLSTKQARKILAQLEGEIEIGDAVVHEDHGIGIYMGIKQEQFKQRIPLGFNEFKDKIVYEDYLLIAYAEGDELYVPLSQIDKITKYIGADSEDPKITRLGKTEWANLKAKVKESVAIMAAELVKHYAERELATTDAIPSEETTEFNQFVEDFPYQETEDQLRTQREVFKDLNQEKPMNRLIVGDVGFGKTEIAMRAAFKVAEAGKQIAVLCPTTVLASQHLQVFRERFASSNFKIEGLSRFSKTDHKQVISDLEEGKVDIVIGTHRLLSNDIKFKKLGLLIIDEEQKFGVKQKEKMKQLEYKTHVLLMSATPIPRTLSMALSSIQEISLIQTPPEGRKQVQTFVQKYNDQRLAEAIIEETKRGGQIYLVHNRVRTINSKLKKLQQLLPGVRFAVAHGQMQAEELEKKVHDFYEKKYDVLLCTTIIENGIDMPNVNTIIIEHAQNFGLGQLYQLRGRVGRGERQAYAYMFYEGEDINKKLTEEEYNSLDPQIVKQRRQHQKYKERLKALLDLDELGSGFSLASRDLEIRGAGNLLGKQQHGNINYVGYGLYMQLLANEIERLKALT